MQWWTWYLRGPKFSPFNTPWRSLFSTFRRFYLIFFWGKTKESSLWLYVLSCAEYKFFYICEKCQWNFGRVTFNLHCFGLYEHFHSIYFLNPRTQAIFPFICVFFNVFFQCLIFFPINDLLFWVFYFLGLNLLRIMSLFFYAIINRIIFLILFQIVCS